MVKKFIMLAGFSIAVTSFTFQYTKDIHVLIAVFVVVYLILWLLLEIEKHIRDSSGYVINRFFYLFSRTNDKYTIEYVETFYEFISKKEMVYSKDIEIKSCVNDLKAYEDKLCWSSYSSSFAIVPKYENHTINHLASRHQWNVFEIDLGQRYKKRKTVKTGYKVTGLIDELGIAKPFLSHRTEKKVKERIMTVIIPKELKPINAKFEIYKSNETGKIIKSEPIEYDERIKGFSKKILYPRRECTYAIVWEWGE